MKKAKQYIEQLKDFKSLSKEEQDVVLFDFYKEFLNEGIELMEQRGETDKIMIGILNELDNKWKSIASKCPFLNKDGYRNSLMSDMPSVKLLMGW